MKRLGLLLLMVLGLGGAAHAAPRYELILLDSLEDYVYSFATAINNRGEVVGFCTDLDGNARATYWDPNNNYAPVNIGTLGGADTSMALGINDSGDVVGVAYMLAYNRGQAFIWNAKTRYIVALQGLPDSEGDVVYSIGNNGKACGFSNIRDLGYRACIFQRDKPGVDISYGFSNHAIGFGDSGKVVGNENSSRTNNVGKAVVGQGDFKEITSLTPGEIGSGAQAVNKNGFVVGSSNSHGFLWDGSLHDLGTLGGTTSQALAINDSCYVAGWSYTTKGETSAFLFLPGTAMMIDLNLLEVMGKPSGLRFTEAHGINDGGEIVGYSKPQLAFLLRPRISDLEALIMLLLLN